MSSAVWIITGTTAAVLVEIVLVVAAVRLDRRAARPAAEVRVTVHRETASGWLCTACGLRPGLRYRRGAARPVQGPWSDSRMRRHLRAHRRAGHQWPEIADALLGEPSGSGTGTDSTADDGQKGMDQ